MCFVWISEQTAIISLYNINWLVCITQTEGVYFAVRAEALTAIQASYEDKFVSSQQDFIRSIVHGTHNAERHCVETPCTEFRPNPSRMRTAPDSHPFTPVVQCNCHLADFHWTDPGSTISGKESLFRISWQPGKRLMADTTLQTDRQRDGRTCCVI